MAVRASIATGNFLTAGTWGFVDSTSYLNAENATESLLTTAYSGTRSASFNPGAIVVSHIGVKLAERIGTTGTISVSLRDARIGADDFVTGTEVTVDVADLPSALEADLNGGWIFFKLASPVTLSGGPAYNVQAKTSSATQVDLFCDATVDNLSRALITTTTGAPAAGDDLIVAGEYVNASTFNTFTVTMNETATTDYGSASTSLVTPALAICNGGTLSYGTTAATNYYLRLSGNAIVYSGGTLSMGTTGTPIPRDSTASLNFDCGANVDFGLTIRNLGTYNSQGLSRTSGKNIVSCLLNTDEAVDSTSLGVDTDTGWLDNDEIAVASTSRTASECEKGTLNGNAGASSLTVDGFAGVGGGLAFAHSGTSPTQAEVILLTRNVKIFGASASLQSFVDIKATATVDVDWTEFYWLGSATSLKRGITCAVTTGSVNIQFSSLHNFEVASSYGLSMSGTTGTGLTFSNNVTFLIASNHLIVTGSSGSSTFGAIISMRNTSTNSSIFVIADHGSSYTNLTAVGCAGTSLTAGISISGTDTVGTMSNITAHSNAGFGINVTGTLVAGTFTNLTVWRNSSSGIRLGGNGNVQLIVNVTITNLIAFGNTTSNLSFGGNADGDLISDITLNEATLNGDTTFSTTSGLGFSNSQNAVTNLIFNNCDFGTVSGIKTTHTNDILLPTNTLVTVYFNNTKLASATEISGQTNLVDSPVSFISSQKHDQTAGNHKTWKKYGTITTDTTANMYRTASPSERLTPNNASGKLISGSKKVAVANGQTVTINTYVRESVAGDGTDYNGARPRLILKRNDAMGI